MMITGSNGLLGQKLIDLYRQEGDRVAFLATARGNDRYPEQGDYAYRTLDIGIKADIDHVMNEFKPHVVIHTAAMTNVDQCEQEVDACRLLNVTATEWLVEACNRLGSRLVHVSTDFIFDGKEGPYDEAAHPAPLSVYGWSKWDAERFVMAHAKAWSILRTVLVFGIVSDMSRSNIVLWAKGALSAGKSINVVDDQFRTPTLAEDLAMGCLLAEKKDAQGVYNISGPDYMSVYELVERVARYWKLDTSNMGRVSSDTLKQPAKRPPITGFNIEKARKELGFHPHSFEEALDVVAEQLKAAGV